MKRFFDVVFSLVALGVFAIPSVFVCFLLRCKEGHPIIFKQERIGFGMKKFFILKFQTLVDGKPTATGRFLRETGLDEVPQFINVLKGEMSVVGPRALTEYDVKRLGWDKQFYRERWQVFPGITGLAQIYGGQHKKTSWFWDKRYVELRNLWMDCLVVGASFLMNVFGKVRVRNMIWFDRNLK